MTRCISSAPGTVGSTIWPPVSHAATRSTGSGSLMWLSAETKCMSSPEADTGPEDQGPGAQVNVAEEVAALRALARDILECDEGKELPKEVIQRGLTTLAKLY